MIKMIMKMKIFKKVNKQNKIILINKNKKMML